MPRILSALYLELFRNANPGLTRQLKAGLIACLLTGATACSSTPAENNEGAIEAPSVNDAASSESSQLGDSNASSNNEDRSDTSVTEDSGVGKGIFEQQDPSYTKNPTVISGGAPTAESSTQTSTQNALYEQTSDSHRSNPSVVSFEDYKDPLEPINRAIFKFNDVSYRYVLSPVSKGYNAVLPKPVKSGIGNFFANITEPLSSLNHLFQGKFSRSGKNLARFGINTTVGVLGIWDAADSIWAIEDAPTSFEDTLSQYNVGYGTYLVLPLLGPSDLRDSGSKVFNFFAHPINFIADDSTATIVKAWDGFHTQAPTLERYPEVVEDVDDKYEFVRNFYLQGIQRDAQVLKKQSDDTAEKPSDAEASNRPRKTSRRFYGKFAR